MRLAFSLLAALAVVGCSGGGPTGPVNVAIVGNPEGLFQGGLRLPVSAQHLRSASSEGLVALDPGGEVVPALAERWIITDDGRSYIFRLRDMQWPDGSAVTAQDVRALFLDTRRRLENTSLGLDLAKIEDVRAMTGRVIEIRLTAAMPEFLRLLAQAELGFVKDGSGTGPMIVARDDGSDAAVLSALPPEARGFAAREDWEELARQVSVQALPGPEAVAAFDNGDADLVLNARLAHLPLANTGPLTRGTVRIDAAWGQFGFVFRRESGLYAEAAQREALSMAIDRSDLMQPFNIGGWIPALEVVPRELWSDVEPEGLVWADWSMERRRSVAASRISQWQAESGQEARVTISMPSGPGSNQLFNQIAEDFAAIGVGARLVAEDQPADLILHDRVARYASPRWFLNQFNCNIRSGPCSPEADDLVARSLGVNNLEEKASLLAEAELELTDAHVFIPLGAPIRWSLVRSNVSGYAENQWGIHPLFPLSQPTI